MKVIYIYSKEVAAERELIDRVKEETKTHIDIYELDEIPTMLRAYVRATPACIIVQDDLQGEHIVGEDANGELLVTGMLYKRMQEEDAVIHNIAENRLDCYIQKQIQLAVDAVKAEPVQEEIL